MGDLEDGYVYDIEKGKGEKRNFNNGMFSLVLSLLQRSFSLDVRYSHL